MEFIIALKLGLLFLCLCGSAFFSASETALFSLDTIKIRRLNQQGKNTFAVMRLLENPLHSLTTILAGNTLVNIAVSAIITSLSIDIFGSRGLGISIGVTTLVLLMFGEVTPKTIAIHNSERLAYLFSVPLLVFGRLAAPFLMVATKICDAIIAFFHLSVPREPTLTEEEFRTVMEVGHRHGVVGKSEKEMVVSILELTTTTTLEVMAPRMDIRAIGSHWDLTRAREFAHQAKHSKFPVYKDSYDNILGMVL
ncbi:MAG: CNNM domain-containing protein, partial [Candidatus Omnitrophota bacterium]